jgi:ribosomal protein S18 acetylase RimI-like enzyme
VTELIGQTRVIRRAERRDIEALVELLATLFTIETDFTIDARRQRQGLLLMLERTEQCCIMVAESENQVVGMCTGQLLVSTAEGGLKVIVEDLVVAAEKRGCGIGSLLVAAVEQWAVSCGAARMDLLADQRNCLALGFYQQRNWQCTELIALQKRL